jgi:glycogen(starch) synthase
LKILVVSAFYPPHHIGGYELGCRDVVNQLRSRGHQVPVLTSDFRFKNNSQADDPDVFRWLHRVAVDRTLSKKEECGIFMRVFKKFQPDIVYFWSQSELCFWLQPLAYWQGSRTAFFLSDANFLSWRVGAWLAGGVAQRHPLLRALLGKTFLVRGKPIVEEQVCHFASEFLRTVAAKNNIRIAQKDSLVAHWGIEQSQFTVAPRVRWPVKRLLYVGQMIKQKGVHTAIRAMAMLAGEKEFAELSLTLVGGAYLPDYEKSLRELTVQLGLGERVIFRGKIPRAELPRIYEEHDVLIFPSEWDEPFAITPLEATASGLAVVGTTTGGSGELFRNRETAMTFRAGEAGDCARAIRELCAERVLFETISGNAQRIVRERHTRDAMVDAIEKSLLKITGQAW